MLCGHVVVVIIGGVKCNGAAHGLKVKTVSAGGAGVDHLNVLVGKNSVPQSIVSLNISVFQHSLAVGLGFGGSPDVTDAAGVEVLTVEGNSAFVKDSVYAVDHEVKGLGIAQIEHLISVGAEGRVVLGIISDKPFSLDTVGVEIRGLTWRTPHAQARTKGESSCRERRQGRKWT